MSQGWRPEGDEMPDDAGGVGGDFRAARPRAESPMTWSLPLCRLGGITVRVHAMFLLLAAVELLRSSVPGVARTLALPPTAMVLGFLLALSLVHEAARCLAARRAGGFLDEWLLWPLGGLVAADPGDAPRKPWVEWSGWFAVGLIGVVNGVVLWQLTGRVAGVALPVPWSLEEFRRLSLQGVGALVEACWLLQWIIAVFLSLAVLPALPLAGGRALLAVLERSMGWSMGVRRCARVGIVMSVLLLVAGLVWDAWTLTGLALVTWICSRETLLRVEAGDALLAPEPEVARRVRREPDDQAELDRILEKINQHGMGSLNFLERRRLKAATRRRQGGDGVG